MVERRMVHSKDFVKRSDHAVLRVLSVLLVFLPNFVVLCTTWTRTKFTSEVPLYHVVWYRLEESPIRLKFWWRFPP